MIEVSQPVFPRKNADGNVSRSDHAKFHKRMFSLQHTAVSFTYPFQDAKGTGCKIMLGFIITQQWENPATFLS